MSITRHCVEQSCSIPAYTSAGSSTACWVRIESAAPSRVTGVAARDLMRTGRWPALTRLPEGRIGSEAKSATVTIEVDDTVLRILDQHDEPSPSFPAPAGR